MSTGASLRWLSRNGRLIRPVGSCLGLFPVVDKTEFVFFRVLHQAPAISVLVIIVLRHPFATKILNSLSGSVTLIDGNVEVKSILHYLPLGYPLKADSRAIRGSRREIHILRRIPKSILDVDPNSGSPHDGHPFR